MRARKKKGEGGLGALLPLDAYPLTGDHCGECGRPRRESPSGAVCENGHGGGASLEETRGPIGGSGRSPTGGTPTGSSAAPAVGATESPAAAPAAAGGAVAWRELASGWDTTPAVRAAAAATLGDWPAKWTEEELQAGAVAAGVTLRAVDVPTSKLVQIETWPADDVEVRGAIVKLTPTIRSSEREGFDGNAAKKALLARGAVAVLVLPRTVADAVVPKKRDQAVRQAAAPHDAINAWFDAAVGLDDKQRSAAKVAALDVYDAANAAK